MVQRTFDRAVTTLFNSGDATFGVWLSGADAQGLLLASVCVQFMASCCEAALSSGSLDEELTLMLAVTHSLSQWHMKLEAT